MPNTKETHASQDHTGKPSKADCQHPSGIVQRSTLWMVGPDGGSPQEVEGTADKIVPLMVKGWTQCEPPAPAPKKNKEKLIDGKPA